MSLLANHLLRCVLRTTGCSPLLGVCGSRAEPRKTVRGKKSLEVPLLLRSHSASPQGPEEFDAFLEVTNVLASCGFPG